MTYAYDTCVLDVDVLKQKGFSLETCWTDRIDDEPCGGVKEVILGALHSELLPIAEHVTQRLLAIERLGGIDGST